MKSIPWVAIICCTPALNPHPAWAAAHLVPLQMSIDDINVLVELDAEAFRISAEPIVDWIKRCEAIVSGYYGRFPTRTLRVRVVAQDGEGVRGGQTFAQNGGGFVRVQVGRDVTEQQLQNDWVLVHEMTHLALPDVGSEHVWLSEGLATYVEGIARVQAGNRTQADVFTEEARSMPRGLPQSGDQGLDHTHTWGRTYWGGAMFCLLADVEIHRQTHNQLGLQDALRAVAGSSGGLVSEWPIERVLQTGDAAVGTHVLEDLYTQMKAAPVTPDLMALWRELGVEPMGSTVRLRDDAPLSEVRHAIMQAHEPTARPSKKP
jgi:hypothetical protein